MKSVIATVLMPVFNGEKFLREAIESILNQTFVNFEFLIINDGSTDATEDIILSYSDLRIRYVKNESNMKLIASLNKGIELSFGKYIVRMDADDISLPDRLEKQVEFMENNPEIGISGTWFNTFDHSGIKGTCRYSLDHNEICFKHLYQIHISHGTSIFRKSVLENHRLAFDKDFSHAEDYEFFVRLAKYTKLANIPYAGYLVRHHEDEVSVKFNDIQRKNCLRIRQLLFEQFKLKPDQADLIAFEELNHQNYKAIPIKSDRMRLVLEDLVLGNRENKFIDPFYFEIQVKYLWLNYCYHRATLKEYRRSELLYEKTIEGESSYLKWVLKSIMRKIH